MYRLFYVQSTIINLSSEVKTLQEKYEESLTSLDRELKRLNEQIRETGKQREAALREVRRIPSIERSEFLLTVGHLCFHYFPIFRNLCESTNQSEWRSDRD